MATIQEKNFRKNLERSILAMFGTDGNVENHSLVDVNSNLCGGKNDLKILGELIEKHVPSYNFFDGAKIAKFINDNEAELFKVSFGRHSSPKIVFHLRTLDIRNGKPEDNQKICKKFLQKAIKALKPDEAYVLSLQNMITMFQGKLIETHEHAKFVHFEIHLWWD